MRFSKACGKYQKKSHIKLFLSLSACLFFAFAAGGAAARPVAAAAGQSGQEQVRESELRAFCPPAEFAEGAYAYRIYGSGGALKAQAAIAAITRDCRYDNDKGLIQMHIAAALRLVPAAAAGRAAATLPIEVKIARGAHVLFAKIYEKRMTAEHFAAQFLFSEWVTVKKAEALPGTKLFIGFANAPSAPSARAAGRQAMSPARPGAAAAAGGRAQRQPIRPKRPPERISPNAGALTIPESF